MSSILKSGTPCFLANLVEMQALAGRVVEVVALVPTPPDEVGEWYQVRAEWANDVFPDSEVHAPRRHLIPICPPDAPSPALAAERDSAVPGGTFQERNSLQRVPHGSK